MCVPPCDCGVKPMPPKPASRPECISTSVTSAARQNLDHCRHLMAALPGADGNRRRSTLLGPTTCDDPAPPRHGRQPAQAGCGAREGARELPGGAGRGPDGRARGGGQATRRAQAGRSRAVDRRASSTNLSLPRRLTSSREPRRAPARFGRARRVLGKARPSLVDSRRNSGRIRRLDDDSGVTAHLRGPPQRVATAERAEAIASSVASPNGSQMLS